MIVKMLKIMKKGRFENNDETTASLAWSTCSSAGVSPEKEKSYKKINMEKLFGLYDICMLWWKTFTAMSLILWLLMNK